MTGGREGQGRGARGSQRGRGRGPGGTVNRNQGGGRGRGRGSSQSTDSSRGRGRGGRTGGRSNGPSLPPNPSSMQFIRALKKCPNNRLKQQIEQLEKSWLSCWQDVGHLHFDAVKTLLSALARLPFSVSIVPPPPPAISQAVSALLSQIVLKAGGDEDFDGNDDTLEGVELVERVVTRLLKFTWSVKRGEVKDALDDMIAEADGSLNVRLKTHRPVRSRLTALLSEIEKPWSIKVKIREETEVDEKLVAQDWRHPSVAWLADVKNFQPALLPRLQLRNSNEGRVYDSSDEYFTTIVKLWIGMTFVEGNNALLPHCTVKVGDKVCDQPLWPFPGKQSSTNCKNSQCRRNSTFVCANRQHSKGLCDGCATEYQKRLRGPPSKYSSTHIYDGSIAHVKYDGTMTIEQVASRKPPLNPIHWRTTKRLSSPNLIGIVRLPSREASLQTCDEIYWAEIIFQGKSFDEYKAREHGRLSLRLLQYLDEPGNAMLTHNPAVGDAVAIIDCQTFVPEFVPVLKALEMQRQMPVPFQEGALLNLCEHNTFGSRPEPDEGDHRFEDDSDYDYDSDYDDDLYPTTDISSLSTRELIRKVIQLSLLDPIIDIRRDGGLRNELETRLLQLVNSATLDPGQLRSFTESLMYPVHCTQGPPGTGKSYLGVVVVRALLIIRDLWKRKNRDVGDPPILVLSYKNHAIDEFLLDLLRSEPTLDHGPRRRQSFAKYYTNNGFKKLIRIGGGCNEPELEPYRERNAAFSDPRVRKASKRIEECQDLREQWHKFRDCFSPIFEAQATVAGGTKSLTSDEWKIVQSAVPAAASAVATLQKLSDKNDDKILEADTEKKPATDSVPAVAEAEAASPLQAVTTVLTKKPSLTNSDIVRLYEGIKHYDPAIDPLEVLYRWMSGFCPLPACSYSESCSKVCCDKSRFCEEHSCKFTSDGERFCLGEVVLKRSFCQEHLCSVDKCKSCRVTEGQSYCEDHACFVCLVRNEPAELATDEPPRNACERHPLCWALDGMCSEVAELDKSYCKAHIEELFCKWKSTEGGSCEEIATSGQYCGSHHAEMLAEAARAAKKSTGKCQVLTKKGKSCRGKPLPASEFCADHVGRSHIPAAQTSELTLPKFEVQDEPKKAVDREEATENDQSPLPDLPPNTKESEKAEADAQNDDVWSLDSDVEDFEDAVQYDNEDEVEESEHLQHMRDVYEVGDDEIDDESEGEEEIEEEEKSPWAAPDQQLVRSSEWHWDMTLEQRWNALFSVLDLWNDVNSSLQKAFGNHIGDLKTELQREILRANSRVYEGKSVIGGTITGCVARLEAIRTTNPFAILVEEASEVMEPLLVSCFSSSTRKLEMIGDHMQLQPSVMGRIDFERVNKINISMFERLISAPHGNEVPSSVLSIQRRMRKSICDLTRNFYDEITEIVDHAVCGTKVIGGAKRKPGALPLLDACEGGGREVPGLLPHIFFWSHSGRQERASVGLSRVNKQEADMACKLVKYLTHCGVPAKSIAVLTPYKGQLMLMRKILMNMYGLKMMPKGGGPVSPSCTVSTVDRFQGDEADIVIISLVIDGKSRTQFVKLQNRMIVALSRARLGMYVVGNVEYFGEATPHWQKTLGLLRKDAESDNFKPIGCATYAGVQIGPALPICCPEHRTSNALAKGERDLQLGFCKVVCSVKLVCSHGCGLNCHWPNVDMHNKKCSEDVESPCSRHPRVLKCSSITGSQGISITEALKKYQCDVQVDVSLRCGHSQKMACFSHTEIEARRKPWPVCNKQAIAPYLYPECKHLLTCMCSEFDRYSMGLAPPCTEQVEYTPPCQHTVTLTCHDRRDYTSKTRAFVCKEKVKVALPRCGHETVVSCTTAETLKQWSGESCVTPNLVKEGELYGPKDYFCKRSVKFQRLCGHHETVRCERAFELAQNPSRCQEPVVVSNPECGHDCSTMCYEAKQLSDKVGRTFWGILRGKPFDPVETVHQGDPSNYLNLGLGLQCNDEVTYVHICGHKQKLKCSDARHATFVCEEQVVKELPVCGHVVRLPCHLSASLNEWQPWQVQSPQIQLLHEDGVVEDTLPVPGSPPTALRSILKSCTVPVRFRRTSSCGHDIEVKCCEAFKFLKGKETPCPCEVQVQKQLNCGHEVAMKCSDDVDSVVCLESVEKGCWNFATCGSSVAVSCTVAADTVQCATETEWFCSEGHSFQLRLCSRGLPSDCPSCSTTRLDTEIKSAERVLSDKKLALWAPEAARFLPEMTGVTHITMSLESKRNFLIRKLKLLRRFKDGLTWTEWANPLFFPVEIPVFVELSRKLQNQHIDSFEMKDFGSLQNFNGIEVYEATQENLHRILSGGKAVVLFGFLYTAKYLTNPVDIPKNKGMKDTKVRNWVTRQVSHGYDALYRDVKAGKKGGSWIVWHPHALFPVHRVEITDTNSDDILTYLPEKTQVHQQDLKISFKKAAGVTKHEEESTPVSSVVSEETIDRLRLLCASVSPLYEKLNVWYPWDGKTFSTGASEVIPQKMEKTLASKLSFVPNQFAGSTQQAKTPFGGIKYLQNLQSQEKLKEDGDLFLSLELLAVRKLDTSETRVKLEEYVTRVCREEAGYAHPLVIVAIARLASRVSKTQSSGVQRKLLKMFTSLYPEASEVWLDATEATLIKTVTSPTNAVDAVVSGSSVKDKWKILKSQYGCRSEAMEDLLKLVGLKKVKQTAVNLFKTAMALQQMSPAQRKKNSLVFNYCFSGNPGTGKTTVARLFAKILKDSKIRPTNTFVECTAQKLKDEGADGFRSKVEQAKGGVLFIDEAYELDPKGDSKGKPIVAELLTASEDKREEISVILAGYEEDIQKKLYAYNDGLKSRFEEVMFEDFDAQDLEVIWDGMAKDRGWTYEKAIAKVAMRRLAKSAGRKGFGNARAVRKLFEGAVKEAMAREDFNGELKLQTVDLLGERPSTNPKLATVLKEVEEKTGWHKIKEEMKNLVRISDENYERELKGQEPVEIFYNRLFLGNPGTGKTTCAQYYGRLLKALHFLSNGEVVKKTAGDFIGQYIGESKTKTVQILNMAQGKVLVIDEAYTLNDDQYGKQVLDVLVEKVQGTENDDLAVLLIGYEDEMLEMLRAQNQGLMRRFPPQYAFHFEDYTDHELLDILEWNCTKRSVTCPYEVAESLLKQLALQKTQPNFGNAGAVEQLLKSAMGKAMKRPMVNGMTVLTLEDVDGEGGSEEDKDPIKLLDKLYRMDEIKEQLIQLRNEMIVADREGSKLPKVGHFVFRGSPGTGKTTVARVMAEILHGMGVLATTKLIETSGLELTAEYAGQTKEKVNVKLGEAKGGLLFIDEAYELGKGKFGEEAMTTLVAAMTNPSYVGMVIIIAGYPKDIDQMLDRNVGLKSRFTKFIDFPDWEPQDAVVFLSEKAETESFEVESEAVLSLQKTFVELKKLGNFGNGRDAVRMWNELMRCRSQRVVKEPELERTITEDDAEKAGEVVLVARRGGGVPGKGVSADEDPMKLLDELYRMDQIRAQLTRLKMEMIVAEREGSDRPEIGHFVFRGSPGTGKTTVARVMAQILYAMGALATTKLVETSGLDLTGEYLGQTKTKVTDKLVEAKGGLLFIDEAYELGKGHFGEEAMTTLVAAMTDPVYAGMVIVIAGYPHDMDTMLKRNAGLKSRFTRYIDFPDWEAEDGVAFLKAKAEKEEIQLESGVEKLLTKTFTKLKKLDGFGNGRDAVQLWKDLRQSRAQRVFDTSEEVRTITMKDAAIAGKIILAARRPPRGSVPSQSSAPSDMPMFMTQEQQPSARNESIQEFEEEELSHDNKLEEKEDVSVAEEELEDEAEEDAEEENVDKKMNEERDPGVSDEDWEELERAKEAHAAHLESLKRAKEEHAAHLESLKHAREQKKIEEERRRAAAIQEMLDEERHRAAAIQEKIRQICPCPAGFNWYKCDSGWRCGGGSHFVSDAQLNSHFTC